MTPSQYDPEAYFNAVLLAFRQAELVAGSEVREYRIGRSTVRQNFAGHALISRLTPALEHLGHVPLTDQQAPDLTVCVWDSASTSVALPPFPWSPNAYEVRGAVRGYNDGRIFTAYEPGVNILNMLDTTRAIALYWVADAATIPYWESSFPMRTVLNWHYERTPFQLVHAGAVGLLSGGVLIAGKSGSGKSTTTLACLDSNLLYLGDDYTMVDIEQAYVYSVYNTAKVESDNLHRLPVVLDKISNPEHLDSQKALIFLHDQLAHKLTHGFPIKAILTPVVSGKTDTYLRKVSASAALFALAPSTVFNLPGVRNATFDKIVKLVKSIPCYSLEAGTDLSQIPDTILQLLRA